ncbi:MAG: Ldh family oxidoreductase [Candidatus Latescibacteria bacterium]|nr:Ldh family oxidoreductase [Candidatus Latescibacterota bacterium]
MTHEKPDTPEDQRPLHLPADRARAFCQDVFSQLGAPEDEARTCSDLIVETSLRGIDSHGITILPVYARRIRSGQIRPGVQPEVVRQNGVTALMDGRQGLGHVTSVVAMDLAISKALDAGVGAVSAFNLNHNGAISLYALRAAERGLIGLCMANATPRVAPYGGREGVHGTNPIAYAIPAGTPIVFDCATGHAAAPIARAKEAGRPIPPGVALDREGRPTTDAGTALEGWLLPVGGVIGYGFGLLVDVLVGALSGSCCGKDVPPVSDLTSPYGCGFFALALDPSRFAGEERFRERVDFLTRSVRACPPMKGMEEVRLPGQRGDAERGRRLREGIPFEGEGWRRLMEALAACGLDVAPWQVP